MSPAFKKAASSLVLPLDFTISHVRLSGLVTLVVSKARGVIVVFQNDPLQSVKITSSLDFLPGASDMLKQEIEEELSLMFSDYIPEMLNKMSQQNPEASNDQYKSLIEGHDKGKLKHLHKEMTLPLGYFTDALINSSSLRSVKDIRERNQTLSVVSPFDNDTDVFNRTSLFSLYTPKPVKVPEDDFLDPYPVEKKNVRKQRRVISLRKTSFSDTESKKSVSLSGQSTPACSPMLEPMGSSQSSPRFTKQYSNNFKSRLDSRSPSVSPSLMPRGNARGRNDKTFLTPHIYSSPGAVSACSAPEDSSIPVLDFENLSSASITEKTNLRRLSNVATPQQIFASASLSSLHHSSKASAPSSSRTSPSPRNRDTMYKQEHATPPLRPASSRNHPTQFFLTTDPTKPSHVIPPPTNSAPLHDSPPAMTSNDHFTSLYQAGPTEVPFASFHKATPPPMYQ